jgi:hypothetical protein
MNGVLNHIILVIVIIFCGYLVNVSVGSGYHHTLEKCVNPSQTSCLILKATTRKCTQLYVFTFPVQKGPCVSFKHPKGAVLVKAINENIRFNFGLEAATNSNSTAGTKCPSSDRSFCEGYKI